MSAQAEGIAHLEELLGKPKKSGNELAVDGLVYLSKVISTHGQFHFAGGKAAHEQLLNYALVDVMHDDSPLKEIIKAWGVYGRDCGDYGDESLIDRLEDCASHIEDACAKMLSEISAAQAFISEKSP